MGKRSFKKAFKVQDEWKTPSILVNMIVPYLKKWEADFISKNGRKPILWLPCDEEDSNYYIILKKEGFEVVRSHLNDDEDFFKWQPDNFDIAVTNIPFSLKMDFFERMIFDLKKPFVFLMNIMALNYQCVGNLFQFVNPKIQFIIPDKKVSFNGKTSSFCSGYVCYDFIDHTEFCHLPHNNTGKNFSK
jgi:hypothetical protein